MPIEFSIYELEAAARVVYDAMPATPQYRWPMLEQRVGAELWVKHENHTPTCAFKVRGGLVLMDALRREGAPAGGVVSATRGNHGQSLAFAGQRAGIPVTIVVPRGNCPDKCDAMRALGANVIEDGDDFDHARGAAARLAEQRGLLPISPFRRELVVGVATYALELFRAAPALDMVYVPIGMGSGICGLIRTRDLLGLATKIVGVVAEGAPAFARSFEAGTPVSTPSAKTIADGIATREPLGEVVDYVRAGAERIVTVTDAQIAEAMAAYYRCTHNLAEGAGAAALAGFMKEGKDAAGSRSGVILCGGNVDFALFQAQAGPYLD